MASLFWELPLQKRCSILSLIEKMAIVEKVGYYTYEPYGSSHKPGLTQKEFDLVLKLQKESGGHLDDIVLETYPQLYESTPKSVLDSRIRSYARNMKYEL